MTPYNRLFRAATARERVFHPSVMPQMPPRSDFVSEPIVPDRATFDAAVLARGEPGLPAGFTWRGRHYAVLALMESWKASEAAGHRPGGQRYYRKRFFRVRVDSGETMTLYVLRHVKPGEPARRRWWLYAVERGRPPA